MWLSVCLENFSYPVISKKFLPISSKKHFWICFNSDSDLNSKISKANWIEKESNESFYNVLQEKEIEVLTRELDGDLIYDTLCNIDSNYCLSHPTINNRLEQENFNILESCQYLEGLNSDLSIITQIKDISF